MATVVEALRQQAPGTAGLLLAAGGGSRMGTPKSLMRDRRGDSWLCGATRLLLDAGCAPVIVVLGAASGQARALLDHDPRVRAEPRVVVVEADEWTTGLSASLAAGLASAAGTDASAVLVTLVDLPGLPASALHRMLHYPTDAEGAVTAHGENVLRQAVYGGRPGHPVLIGRGHWARLVQQLSGDVGARAYLTANGATRIDCSDLWDGVDVDERSGR